MAGGVPTVAPPNVSELKAYNPSNGRSYTILTTIFCSLRDTCKFAILKRLDVAKDIVFDVGNARSLMMYPDYFHAVFTAVLVISSQSDIVLISVALTDLSTVWSYVILLHSQGERRCCSGVGVVFCRKGVRVDACNRLSQPTDETTANVKFECSQLQRSAISPAFVSPHQRYPTGFKNVNLIEVIERHRHLGGDCNCSSIVPFKLGVPIGSTDGNEIACLSQVVEHSTSASTVTASDIESDGDHSRMGQHALSKTKSHDSSFVQTNACSSKDVGTRLVYPKGNRREVSAFGHIKLGHFRSRKILFSCQQLVSIHFPNMTAPIQCGAVIATIFLFNPKAYHFDTENIGHRDFILVLRSSVLLLSAEFSFFVVCFYIPCLHIFFTAISILNHAKRLMLLYTPVLVCTIFP